MNSIQEIKDGFIRIYEDLMRARGMPTIMGRTMAVLLLEGRELNHKEISRLTGYSMASVNRTLNQLTNFNLVHKHKDPIKKNYVFHVNVDFSGLFADIIEKMVGVYETQSSEINALIQKLDSLESEEPEQAEVDRLRTVLEKFNNIMEVTAEVLGDMVKELRSRKDSRLLP